MTHDKTVNKVVIGFRKFLTVSWESFLKHMDSATEETREDLINDWLQMNWEVLVERIICSPSEYIEEYWNGAEINGISGRVTHPDASATHRIICKSKEGLLVKDQFSGELINPSFFTFEKFVSKGNNKYLDTIPFDHVLLAKDNELYLVELSDINFDIIAFEKSGTDPQE